MGRAARRWCFVAVWLGFVGGAAAAPVEVQITGDHAFRITRAATADAPALDATFAVDKQPFTVTAEKHAALPLFNPAGPPYARGARLEQLKAEGLTAPDLIIPESIVVRTGAEESSTTFERGKDYEVEPRWGSVGRLPGGAIGEKQPVYISYRHYLQALDSVALSPAGKLEYVEGKPAATNATAPELPDGYTRVMNVWFTKPAPKLSPNQFLPILETAYPEPAKPSPTIAEQRTPKAVAKLRSGEKLRILAWGDSVTDGSYLPNPARERWQEQFVARLKERFPKANIELVTEAWGGRNTDTYLSVPPGQEHNYQETVLGAKPDLVVSEFVNDAGFTPEQVEAKYAKFLADFRGIGAEWIILTPHYVRPDWMGLDRERDVDQDPRPYVQGLRRFAEQHQVALADASLRYGRLWRQGIPTTAS